MNRQMEFELIFRAQAAAAKNATNDLRNDVAALGNEVTKTAAAFDREAAAMNRDTEATRKNADATNALMKAEAKARQDALEASGAVTPSAPARKPRRSSSQLPATPPVPPMPPQPPTPPANDNEGRDRNRRQNAGYQYLDIGQGIFGGMPLPMIAAQQGPQLLQIYAGQGGINTALKDFRTIAGAATRAITPLTVGIAGLTTVVALGAIAYSGYLQSTKEVETAASGLGRAVAGSRSEMEAAAQAGASAAGISVSSARSMEAQFLRTGRIGSDNFEALISLSKNFGATMGVTTDEAGAMLAEMFADPAKAAETLYQKYGLIDAATARHASNLAAQNRQSEAQAVLLKALPNQLADASEATTALGRAWNAVATGASNAFDWMGKAVDRAVSGPTLEEQIAKAEAAKERLATFGGMFDILNPGKAEAIADAARLPELQAEKRRRDEAFAKQQKEAEENRRSVAAVNLYEASPANSRSMQEQKLRNDIAALKSGSGLKGVDDAQNDAAIEAKTRALDALINRQQRSQELDRLDIQISNERNPLLRAELEARRVSLQLSSEEVSAATIATESARARNRVIGETIAAASAQASDMVAEVETRARLNALVASGAITSADANRMLQEEVTLRPLIAAAMVADIDKKEQLNKVIDDLKTGYAALAEQEKRASLNDYMRGQNDKLEQLRLEKILIAENETTRGRAMALLEAEQKIRSMGLSTTSREAAQIRELSLEQANLTRELEKQGAAWDRVQQAGEQTIDSFVDGLLDGDMKGALENAAKNITSMFTELAIKNPLKNGILGTDLSTMSDAGGLGGIFNRLMGGTSKDPASLVSQALGQSVGTVNLNATNVMVNGGMAGGLGSLLGGGAANDNSNVVPFPGSMAAFRSAIRSIESDGSGGYSALGPITRNGDRAYGAYQVMGANIPSWTKQALGQSMTPQQFLASNSAQDAVFDKVFGGYVSKYGPLGAAQAWFGGPGSVGKGGGAMDMLGTSGTAYVQKFNAALGTATQSTTVAAQGLGNLGTGFSQFGQNLTSFFPSAPSAGGGGIGGFFSKLFGGIFGGGLNQSILNASPQTAAAIASGGGGLFDVGGWTGPGDTEDIAGVVHADEFVFSKKAVQKIGVPKLDAMHKGLLRGYSTGGYVSSGAVYPSAVAANSNAASSVSIAINNYSGQEVSTQETTDAKGNRQVTMAIGQQVAATVGQRGNPMRGAIQREFGLKVPGVRR